MRCACGALLLIICCVAEIASAATLSAGSYVVSRDDPMAASFPVQVFITGGENIANYDLAFAVGDGGSALGGTETVSIVGIDYLAGTIFSGLTLLTAESPALPSAAATSAGLNTDPVTNRSANGLLATLLLDLRGASLGVRGLSVNAQGLSGATDASFAPLDIAFVNGSLTIVPEPSSLVMALLAALGLCAAASLRSRPA